MAKAILICKKFSEPNFSLTNDLVRLSKRLIPGNIEPHSPVIIEKNGISIAVWNPPSSLKKQNCSICIGEFIGNPTNWYNPGGPIPDGNYALFRTNQNSIEILTDFLATRTIWFICRDDVFIASTSQRAIVCLLNDYVPNKESFSWFLSSGNLGPGLSWDARVHCLQGNSCLRLDRHKWKIEIKRPGLMFPARRDNPQVHQNRLLHCLRNTINGFSLDLDKWLLPLSGGYDSRTLLCLFQNYRDIRCVTWGHQKTLQDPQSDASIARKLANHLEVHHEFFPTDINIVNFDNFLDQFCIAGEGRIDHISGYMDGFTMWKNFFESKYEGIIRGDQGFGWLDTESELIIRHSLECILLNEYQLLKTQDFDLPTQALPDFLKRKSREPILDWRDRFFLEFRVPYVKAALNDLKSSYVEIISPFLTRSIIENVLSIPGYHRTNKSLFKKIALSLTPDIEFAQKASIEPVEKILSQPSFLQFLMDTLNAHSVRQLLSPKLINITLKALDSNQKSMTAFRKNIKINSFLSSIKKIINPSPPPMKLSYKRLALRICIIHKMNELFKADTKFLID